MNTEPTMTCLVCGRVIIVKPQGRGFPPETARRKLVKACTAAGCDCQPQYRAAHGFFAPRPT